MKADTPNKKVLMYMEINLNTITDAELDTLGIDRSSINMFENVTASDLDVVIEAKGCVRQ